MRNLTLLIALVVSATIAEAKEYSAARFDSRVEIRTDGSARVTETVVFRFEDGTFTSVFRDIPARRTDGVEIVGAEMDGRPFPLGGGTGQVEVTRRGRVRVRWRFEPVSNASHTFTLTYVLRGVVRQEGNADLFQWRALPSEHAYRIDASTIEIDAPAEPTSDPRVETKRVAGAEVSRSGPRVTIAAHTIRQNGWIETSLKFPRGSVATLPPLWQQRDAQQRGLAPRWIAGAGAVVFAALVLMFGIRQGYDAPSRDASIAASGLGLPDDLPAPIAGALLANGSPNLVHAMATLFILAERGELRISELPHGAFGQRSFAVARTPTGRPLSRSEEAALATMFRDGHELQVTLSKARSRLMHRLKKYRAALLDEMRAFGLLDAARVHVRKMYLNLAVALSVLGGLAFIPVGLLLVDRFGPWPLMIPAAVVAAALIALVFHASATPLSNDAVRRERYWRGFQTHLKDVAADRAAAPRGAASQLLPFAVALGLASAWSKYLKSHPADVPPWFHALSGADAAPAFVTLIAAGAAAGHGGGAGGGGAAGGGASGAG